MAIFLSIVTIMAASLDAIEVTRPIENKVNIGGNVIVVVVVCVFLGGHKARVDRLSYLLTVLKLLRREERLRRA